MRYLLAVLAVIVSTIIMPEVLQMGWYSITYYIDVPNMLLLLLITIPVLASAGLLKDFTKAFRIAFKKVGNTASA